MHDFNCGLKAYRKNVVKSIEVYGEMHRYIPLIAKWSGFKKIGEKVVEHHARKYGVSKFGVGRLITGGLDLASILFVGKYGKRPMHLFGSWGMVSFLVGFGVSFYLFISKFFFDKTGFTQRPLFFVALAGDGDRYPAFCYRISGRTDGPQFSASECLPGRKANGTMKVVIIGPAWPLRGGLASFDQRLCRAFVEEGTCLFHLFFFPAVSGISFSRHFPVYRMTRRRKE